MSISGYTGLPRSGKSHSVVQVMIDAIKEGRTVYTNIPLHVDLWLAEFGACPVVFDSQDIIDNPKWFDDVLPVGALLVADECWRFWPSGMKATALNPVHKEFLAMHGHKVSEDGTTTQIILVCQDLAQLAQFVRQLVDKTFRCTKLDSLGQDKRYRVDIYQGAVTGQKPPQSDRLREMYYKYDPQVFKFYKSATQSKAGDVGNEKRVDDRANLLKGNKFKFIIAGMVLLPIAAIWMGVSVYHHYVKKPEISPINQASQNDSVIAQQKAVAVRQFVDSPLHGRKIVISAASDYGNGVEYVFKVSDGDGFARFEQMQLINAGYRVEPVTECMVKISGFGEVFFAMCVGDKSTGIIAQAFQSTKPDQSL